MEFFGIVIYLITLYIRPQDWISFLLGLPVNDVIISFTMLTCLAVTLSSNRRVILPYYVFIPVFIIVVFLSNAVHGHIGDGLELMLIYIKRFAVFLMFVLALKSEKRIRWTLLLMVFFSTILAFQGIQQAQSGVGWAGQPLDPRYEDIRISWIGDWDGSNVLALLFVIAIPLCLEFILGQYILPVRVLNLLFLPVLLYGIYLTNSRGGVLSLMVALFVYFVLRFKATKSVVLSALAILVILTFAPSRTSEISTKESSARERLWTWEQSIKLIRHNPLLGVGKGSLAKHLETPLLAHNNYVQVAAETGFVGFISWLSIFFFSLKGLYLIVRSNVETEEQRRLKTMARGLLATMVGFGATTFFVTMELDILFVLWSLCAVTILLARDAFSNIDLSITRLDMALVTAGALGILGLVYFSTII